MKYDIYRRAVECDVTVRYDTHKLSIACNNHESGRLFLQGSTYLYISYLCGGEGVSVVR